MILVTAGDVYLNLQSNTATKTMSVVQNGYSTEQSDIHVQLYMSPSSGFDTHHGFMPMKCLSLWPLEKR